MAKRRLRTVLAALRPVAATRPAAASASAESGSATTERLIAGWTELTPTDRQAFDDDGVSTRSVSQPHA